MMRTDDATGSQPSLMRRLSVTRLWPLAIMFVIWGFVNTQPIRPHDFWWHLQAGKEIVTAHRIPTVDTFSYTMLGKPYDNYASFWLMELAYYLLYSSGGPALVILFHSLLVTTAYGIITWLCREISGSWRLAAAGTFFAAALGMNDWNVRPQAIAFPLAALELWAIYAYRARPRAWLLMAFPLITMVWANSHGSFMIGLLLLAIWLAAEAWRLLIAKVKRQPGLGLRPLAAPSIALVTSILASLANPRGLRIFAYVGALSGNPVIRSMVPEWAPPRLSTFGGTALLVGLLFSAIVLALSWRRLSAFQVLTFVTFAILASRTSRGIVWFGMVMAPVLADQLAALNAGQKQPQAKVRPQAPNMLLLNCVLIVLMLSGVVLSLPWFKHLLPLPQTKIGLLSAETPVEATRFLLREHPAGRLFHDQAFGSYLIWAAQPPSGYAVFVDTRIELYPPRIWKDYLDISAAWGDWEGKLRQYGVNTLMLSPEGQPALIDAVRRSASWRIVYEDRSAVILVPNTG